VGGANFDLFQLLSLCIKKTLRGPGAKPSEAETLISFWTFNESRKFFSILIFGDAKKITDICAVLQK